MKSQSRLSPEDLFNLQYTVSRCLSPLQITQQCKKASFLATAQSPVFPPPDPMKASSCGRVDPFLFPTVYVCAPHEYFASVGVHRQPPCPEHGFEAVAQGKVRHASYKRPYSSTHPRPSVSTSVGLRSPLSRSSRPGDRSGMN